MSVQHFYIFVVLLLKVILQLNFNIISILFFQSEGKSGKKPELATVIAPYTATGKEQLTLQKGQMILVRKKTETGWWQGEVQASGTVNILLIYLRIFDFRF